MKTRNKWLLGILCACVLALLIALCFVGNTFARYTLNQSESVTASIAEWGVTLTEDATNVSKDNEVSVGTLKPYATDYDITGATARTSADDSTTSNFVCVATLTNTGAVDATVTVTAATDATSGGLVVTPEYETFSSLDALLARGAAYKVTSTSGNYQQVDSDYQYVPGDDCGYGGSDDTTTGTGYAAEVAKHFTADVYYDTTGTLTLASATSDNKFASEGITLKPESDTDENNTNPSTIYIYLDVEWISDLYDTTNSVYVNGDGFDTWCGMWVSGFSFGLTVEAYQAS